VLARLDAAHGSDIVAVRQGSLLGTAFHPEVTEDTRFHQYFLGVVSAARAAVA
jgi:5'-phosphate synthase pdxT subunit